MAEPEKNFVKQVIACLSDWNWKSCPEELGTRIGWPLTGGVLVVVFVVIVWWKWKEIKERPGIEGIVERFKRKAIGKAPAAVLTIAVAHLQDDEGQKQEKLLLDELKHFDGVETLTVDRAVEWPDSGTEQVKKKKAEAKARVLLKKTGADVLVWGSVISLSGKSAMRLYWTPTRDVFGAKSTGKYQPQTETIALPLEFWSDLKQILGLLTQSRIDALTFDQPGHYVADRLAPLIAQVRTLVQSREGVWNPVTLAGVQGSLAVALVRDGEESGKNASLVESIALYRKVLNESTRARAPLQWGDA